MRETRARDQFPRDQHEDNRKRASDDRLGSNESPSFHRHGSCTANGATFFRKVASILARKSGTLVSGLTLPVSLAHAACAFQYSRSCGVKAILKTKFFQI